jgi:hypothetical protein
MRRGIRLEPLILETMAEELGQLRHGPTCPIDGTPIVAHPDALTAAGQPVEAKTTRVADEWGEPGTDEIPQVYVVQALVQIAACQADLCYVGRLDVSRDHLPLDLYVVPSAHALEREIVDRACQWWREHVEADRPPPLDSPPPLDMLRRLRRQPATVVPIDPAIVAAWLESKEQAKQAQERAEQAQAAVLAALGEAEAGQLPDGRLVTYYAQTRREYVVPASSYRVLRIQRSPK